MTCVRSAALALLIAGASLVPLSSASAQCWHNGWGWNCGPGALLALPFVVAGTAVAAAATIATAPVRAITGPYYYGPPPGYSPAYSPGYYPPPGYYPYYPPPR